MPTPGDQHKEPENILKSGWTKEDLTAIQNRLWKNLGPEFVSYRPAPGGGRVPYLEGWKAINLANDTFGFNGWQSEIKLINIDYCDELSGGRISVGISCVVRVTLKDGSFHEDIGFGHAENVKAKYMAFDKCKKEATTDGLKRALRKFGHVLGNCLYNNNYSRQLSKVKQQPFILNQNELIRELDFQNQLYEGTAPTARPSSAAPCLLKSTPVAKQPSPLPNQPAKQSSSSKYVHKASNNSIPTQEHAVLPPPIPSASSTSRRASTSGDILDPDSFYKFVEDAAAEHDRLYDDLVIDDLMTDDPIFDDDDIDFDEPPAGKVSNTTPPQASANSDANNPNNNNNSSKINLSTEPPKQASLSEANISKNNETPEHVSAPSATMTKNSSTNSPNNVSGSPSIPINKNKPIDSIDTAHNLPTKKTSPTNANIEVNTQPGLLNEPEVINSPIQFFHGSAATLLQKNEPVSPELSFKPSFQSPEIRRTLQHNKSVPIKKSEVLKTQLPPAGVVVSPSSNFSSSTNKSVLPTSGNNNNGNRCSPTPSAPVNSNNGLNVLNKPHINTAPTFSNPPTKAFGAPRRPIARPVPAKRPMADLGKSQINIMPVTNVPADKKQKVDE